MSMDDVEEGAMAGYLRQVYERFDAEYSEWWPDDRPWIVITETTDLVVGASHPAIEDVLASIDVKTIEVTLDTHMDPEIYPPRWR
jgi:hypothetical protein